MLGIIPIIVFVGGLIVGAYDKKDDVPVFEVKEAGELGW